MESRSARTLLWTARITGSVLLGFLLFMLAGHLFGKANGPHGMTFSNEREVLAFVLFPGCTALGLLLAYRWQLLGGALSVSSLVLLMIARPDLLRPVFLAVALPGLLYVAHALLQRRRAAR